MADTHNLRYIYSRWFQKC